MTFAHFIVILLGGLPSTPLDFLTFYPLALICFMLKFLVLYMQRKVRDSALEVMSEVAETRWGRQ
jgi:hypothetical protein